MSFPGGTVPQFHSDGCPSPGLGKQGTPVLSWPGGTPVLSQLWGFPSSPGGTPVLSRLGLRCPCSELPFPPWLGLGYPPGWDWGTPPPPRTELGCPPRTGLEYPPPPPGQDSEDWGATTPPPPPRTGYPAGGGSCGFPREDFLTLVIGLSVGSMALILSPTYTVTSVQKGEYWNVCYPSLMPISSPFDMLHFFSQICRLRIQRQQDDKISSTQYQQEVTREIRKWEKKMWSLVFFLHDHLIISVSWYINAIWH